MRKSKDLDVVISKDEADKASQQYFKGDGLASSVFVGKYALRNEKNEILEKDPDVMHRRLAREFARAEAKYPNPMSEDEIYNLFKGFGRVVPQGSPMSAIGNSYKLQSASNCFVIESPLDSYSGILYTDQQQAQIMKRRGGVGFDISGIRPRGMATKNAAGTTDGIGIFMERFSNTCREVAQNGRRGALMLSISCHHPEIRTFINIKKDLKKVTGANISIRWSDEFLNAVEKNEKVQLRFPVEKNVEHSIEEMVDAKPIWDEFIDAAHTSAEPGCLFWDNALNYTPADIYTEEGFGSISTNPSLRADTLILTKTGIKTIKSLAENEPVTLVRNIRGDWIPGNVFVSGRNKQLYKISFRGGAEVYCTGEHKWPILGKNNLVFDAETGKVSKKSTSEIVRGDRVPLPKYPLTINNPNFKYGREDGFIVGWNLGDGWKCFHKNNLVDQYGFIFSKEDVESGIGERVLRYTNALARTPSTLRQDHGCQAWTFVTTDANVRKHMSNFNITSKEAGIPSSIWESNSDFISGFVDGLFSSDGSVFIPKPNSKTRGPQIVLISAHINLLRDVQKLLAVYGIRSGVSSRKTHNSFPNGKSGIYTRCELKIGGTSAYKFAETFTLSSVAKQKKLNSILQMSFLTEGADKPYLIVDSVTKTDLLEDVYDITVDDDTRTFQTCTGITGNCGEILLSSRDSCRLITMNTRTYVENPFQPNAKFKTEEFKSDVIKAQRLMDDLVDLEIELVDKILAKVHSDPEPLHIKQIELDLWNGIREAAVNGRRTGLGVTAIGDTLAALGLKYGSPKSLDMVEHIYKTLALGAYASTVTMAKERGTFPIFNLKKEVGHPFLQRIWDADPDLYKEYVKYGRRNIALTTTAPTGSVSTMTQTTSGIEPVFMTHYKRRKKINPNEPDARVDFIDELGDKWQEHMVYHHGVKEWMDITGETDVSKSPYAGATANEIDWEAGVELQARAQKWICHAISRTTNLPSTATKEDVHKVYWRGWKSGCKGITVYRDGSRSGVLVADDSGSKQSTGSDGRPTEIVAAHAPKRPAVLPCEIHHATVKGQKWTVLVGLFNGKPYEVFAGAASKLIMPSKCKVGQIVKVKQGQYDLFVDIGGDEPLIINDIVSTFNNEESAWATRMISMSLRHGVDVEFVVDQLSKDGNITDVNKVLSRSLKKHIADGASTFVKCKDCGSKNVTYSEGCLTCKDCGASKC